jgi:hypothetical protein
VGSCAIDCARELASARLPAPLMGHHRNQLRDYERKRDTSDEAVKVHYCTIVYQVLYSL